MPPTAMMRRTPIERNMMIMLTRREVEERIRLGGCDAERRHDVVISARVNHRCGFPG